jgi:hypothetical protein
VYSCKLQDDDQLHKMFRVSITVAVICTIGLSCWLAALLLLLLFVQFKILLSLVFLSGCSNSQPARLRLSRD